MNRFVFFVLVCLRLLPCHVHAGTELIIRQATSADYAELMYVNCDLTFRYFLQIYQQGYADYLPGSTAEIILQQMIQEDISTYRSLLSNQDSRRVFIARDAITHRMLGFLDVQALNTDIVELILFCVLDSARGKGVGKALLNAVCQSYSDATELHVAPYKYANTQTQAFYRAVGFVDQPLPDRIIGHHGIPAGELFIFMIKKIARSQACDECDTIAEY